MDRAQLSKVTVADVMVGINQLVVEKGWYQDNSSRPQTARNLAVSLNLEAAEVLEHFQWGDNPKDLEGVASELADVLIYVAQIANVLKIDLGAVTMKTLEKNMIRQWD